MEIFKRSPSGRWPGFDLLSMGLEVGFESTVGTQNDFQGTASKGWRTQHGSIRSGGGHSFWVGRCTLPDKCRQLLSWASRTYLGTEGVCRRVKSGQSRGRPCSEKEEGRKSMVLGGQALTVSSISVGFGSG